MKLVFSNEVLNDNDKETKRKLSHIVDLLSAKRHVIDEWSDFENTPWINDEPHSSTSMENLEILEKAFTTTAYPTNRNKIKITICMKSLTQDELSPDDAIKCLERPAYVAVENRTSDGQFLDAMIRAFNREELEEDKEDGLWQYEHIGGKGEVKKTLDHLCNITTGPMRVFVFSDSDREYPYEETDTVKKIETSCKEAGDIPYAILMKREMENYLPLSFPVGIRVRHFR